VWKMPVGVVVRFVGGWEGEGGWRTEEETFPDFEEVEGGERAVGAEVYLEGGEGFFAGWSVCERGGFSESFFC